MTQTAPRRLPTAFRALLASEAISNGGTQFTLIAMPFLAATALQATPSQIALLTGAQFIPGLIVTPIAGKLADIRERAPLMFLPHYGRFVLLAVVVALAATSTLTYEMLFAAAMLLGALTAVFDTALLAYVPDTVHTEDLTRANGQLATVYAVAQSAGPAVGGVVVAWVGPLIALAADALSYVVGGAAVQRYRKPALARAHRASASIRAGFVAVARSSPLARLVSSGALYNLAEQVAMSVLFIAVVQEAGRSVALIGFGLSAAGVGGVLGAWASHRIGGRDGDRSWMWSLALSQAALLVALWAIHIGDAGGDVLFLAGMAAHGVAIAFYNVHALTRRQKLSPPGMLGRVNAVYRTLAFGTMPIGAGVAAVLILYTSAAMAATLVAVLSVVATVILITGTYPTTTQEPA